MRWKWKPFCSLWNPSLNQTLDLRCQVTWELLMNDKCGFSSFLRFYDLVSFFLMRCVHPALLHLHSLWLHVLFSGNLVNMTPKYSLPASEYISLAFPKEMHSSEMHFISIHWSCHHAKARFATKLPTTLEVVQICHLLEEKWEQSILSGLVIWRLWVCPVDTFGKQIKFHLIDHAN